MMNSNKTSKYHLNFSQFRNSIYFLCIILLLVFGCKNETKNTSISKDSNLQYLPYRPNSTDQIISRSEYKEKLYGFWLGQCIANWTGLVTEMDKIGNIGDIKTGDFYTREDWGSKDLPNIWSETASDLSNTIDFVFRDTSQVWGADDDTDIEYMYQHLLYTNKTSLLNGDQIKEGWLKHIKAEEENYLWVSNQQAFDLMKQGEVPPETSNPEKNPHFEMIDAQLTTELFGLFAPTRSDIALKLAHLPIRTTARDNAARISEFYVIMHALASATDSSKSIKDQLFWMASEARTHLPTDSYSAKMYDFVKSQYEEGLPWETVRDNLYKRYQVDQMDGYTITAQNLHCNGCFAAGINFGASLISLFYGEGNLKETIKIGVLCGWDSDNPTATWGGLIGFMIGKTGVKDAFGRQFSGKFNIHRTRQNFPNNGLDTFDHMAEIGLFIIDRAVQEQMDGGVNLEQNLWYIPTIRKK